MLASLKDQQKLSNQAFKGKVPTIHTIAKPVKMEQRKDIANTLHVAMQKIPLPL
jgi:hypothetical protein